MAHDAKRGSRVRVTLAAALLATAMATLGTTFGTQPAEAAFPGQNGRIVYEGLELSTFNYEIYTVGANGSGKTRLTDAAGEDRMPAVSPDGETIAFASNRGGANAIYVMGVDGSNPTRITNEPGMADIQPAWSPDGGKIVFQRTILNENNPEIYVVDADGANPTRLTESPTFDSAPVFSPDGTKIAFQSLRDGDNEVFVMGADGSDPTNLTNNTVYDAAPNWSPDGSRIAFLHQGSGEDTEVFVMGAGGSEPTNLTNNDSYEYDPAFSPDGRKVVFSSDRDGGAEIYTINAADGANATRVTDDPTINYDPDWQPLRDTTPPTGSVLVNRGAASTTRLAVTLTLRASDAGARVPSMRVANSRSALASAAWQPFTTTKRWKLNRKGPQVKTVFVQYRDSAGNVSRVVQDKIRYRR